MHKHYHITETEKKWIKVGFHLLGFLFFIFPLFFALFTGNVFTSYHGFTGFVSIEESPEIYWVIVRFYSYFALFYAVAALFLSSFFHKKVLQKRQS
ncbi:hypothetical protein H6501_04630 [Candidatus Woesearchaeota archaeon]|nr:hypothetical protein [Nanoarchaeota archaeon]MCB9370858.1 hypothetical protein [Candidatus Woesearchaeota archaeon]USN43959.1 MAG: hypothetical protein H6500_06235 [Candidatus Woesearchaeota archaeon]